ncbi:MAG: flagellar protein FlbB [Treponema sp.]|jgi:flagellar protein FlbB|nr:flagellar protein FlbB [Treponema sp.]
MAGRVIVLLLLVLVLAAGSIIWFDYLNVIDAKTVLAPLYRYIGREGRSQPKTTPEEYLNLDAERLAVRLDALELEKMELDTVRQELAASRGEIEQMAQELEERQKALDDRENSLRAQTADVENKERNIEENARILTGMDPQRAVGIILAMDDQDVIDVLRKTEELARAGGATSIVPYWFQLMADPNREGGAARAAELQRKMAGRPQSF